MEMHRTVNVELNADDFELHRVSAASIEGVDPCFDQLATTTLYERLTMNSYLLPYAIDVNYHR